MIHTYQVTGMTCASCREKVTALLQNVAGVKKVNVDLQKGEVEITMLEHIATSALQQALKAYPQYQLTEKQTHSPVLPEEEKTSWFSTYKPVLLIFAYITGVTSIIQAVGEVFNPMQWMNHFMAAFFLTFSFFKLLNLQGFADSYSTYDILAKRLTGYGLIYPFIELGLGLLYVVGWFPLALNLVTFVVMGVSLVGVLQSLLNKRKIRCACLGDVFNLPMSTVTVIEDALMILMSVWMMVNLWNI